MYSRRTAGKEPRVNERNEQMKDAGLIQRVCTVMEMYGEP